MRPQKITFGEMREMGLHGVQAMSKGWIELHESGTYVRLLTPGEDLLRQYISVKDNHAARDAQRQIPR